jgi:quaternary ammonium compound-resistance protein SugE
VAWIALFLAGACEILWAAGMKQSEGFSRPVPSLVALIAFVASIILLSRAMRELPLSTAYVIWTGIGAVGTFIVGVAILGESVSTLKLVAACLILSGIILFKLAS